MYSPRHTNMAFQQEIQWHTRDCDERLSGWLQHPAGDPVCQGSPAHGHHMGFICIGSIPTMGGAGESPECDIKPPIGAPLLIFPRGYLLKSFRQRDSSARQQGLDIRLFPLLGELPKTIEPHLSVCKLYRWQLGPSKGNLHKTKSHRSYGLSDGLSRGESRTRHRWICKQFSGAGGGGTMEITTTTAATTTHRTIITITTAEHWIV